MKPYLQPRSMMTPPNHPGLTVTMDPTKKSAQELAFPRSSPVKMDSVFRFKKFSFENLYFRILKISKFTLYLVEIEVSFINQKTVV